MYKTKRKKKEEIKPPIKWTKQDYYSTGVIVLMILAFSLFMKVVPEWDYNNKIKDYSGIATATVVSYKSNKFNSQDFHGGQIKTISCTIDYKYNIKKVDYRNSSTFPNNRKYFAFLKSLDIGTKVKIKYNEVHPGESEIIIE